MLLLFAYLSLLLEHRIRALVAEVLAIDGGGILPPRAILGAL